MHEFFFLYKIHCLINDKNYIGQTVDPIKRWKRHQSDSRSISPDLIINRAMKKHGVNNFSFEVIATCKKSSNANYLETYLIHQYQSHISTKKGYNVSWGGTSDRVRNKSPETITKISKALKGRPSHMKGKTHTEEVKKLLSDLAKKQWENKTDRKKSPETCQKLSEATKKQWATPGAKIRSPETHEKMVKSKQGKPSPKRFIPTPEQLNLVISGDYTQEELGKLLNVSSTVIKRLRKENNQKIKEISKTKPPRSKNISSESRLKMSEGGKKSKSKIIIDETNLRLNILNKNNFPSNKFVPTPEQLKLILSNSYSKKELQKLLNVSKTVIKRLFKIRELK